jgi:hypothetical protein
LLFNQFPKTEPVGTEIALIRASRKRELRQMSRRYKTHIFIVSVALMILFVVGPPAAFASKLPTVCNIFSPKGAEKAGQCGHRAIFLKIQDTSFEVEAVLFFNVNFETSDFFPIHNNPLSPSFPFGSNPQFSPLRC